MNNSRIIILEGPDGGGKTTLAQRLAKEHHFRVIKTGPPQPGENLLRSYSFSLASALADDRPVVFDRHYLGESIYGPILREADTLGEYGRDLLERVCRARGVRVLVVLPNYERVYDAWAKKTEDLVEDPGQLHHVYQRYTQQLTRCRWMQSLDPYLSESLVTWQLHDPLPTLPPGAVGNPTADTLFVGERISPASPYFMFDWPFHDEGACSRYLWDRLRDAGIDERSIAFCNATHRDYHLTHPNLDRTLCHHQWKHVVALGKTAVTELKGLGVEPREVPHPQFWKRFHAHEDKTYEKLLQEAVR